MKTYARIIGGLVVEIITLPSTVNIATMFASGVVLTDITSVSPEPAVGWTYSGGSYAAPLAPAGATPGGAARQARASGCQIVSSSMTALNATYPLTEAALLKMARTAQLITLNSGAFPGSLGSIAVLDAGGTSRSVTTAAAFLALYSALATYALQLDQIAIANSGSLPAQPLTIA